MWLPDGRWYPLGNRGDKTLFFEDNLPVAGLSGRLRGAGGHGALVVHAGDRVTLLTRGELTAYTPVSAPAAVTVGGPATTLAGDEQAYRLYQVEFEAVAGSWIHTQWLAGQLDPSLDYGPRLIGPRGHLFVRSSFWQIPRTGRYRLLVPMAPATGALSLRIRTIRVLANAMPANGTQVTLSTPVPGEWMLAPMTLENLGYRLSSHAATANGPWEAVVTPLRDDLRCPGMAMGCGEFSYAAVSAAQTVSDAFGGYGPEWIMLLRTGPGVTASVELSVAPQQ
jgi:hypothetical protein